MTDQTTDDAGQQTDDAGQQNAVTSHWYDDFAGEDQARQEQLSQFDSFDSFLEDYNKAKNFDIHRALAGDDEKYYTQLQRYADGAAIGNALREAQQKIRAGQLKPELAADASDEQIAEFRNANGIPEAPEGYLENLPEGLVVGDDDKELMLDFLGALHSANADPAIAHAAVEWYTKFEESQQDAIAELDTEQAREATDLLRDAEQGWGKDFRTNMNLINSLLDSAFGEEAKAQLMNGRYQDGRGFFNDPAVLKGLANVARQLNDVAPLIQQDPEKLQSLHDEIASIEALMGNRSSEYYKGPKAEQLQARYRELVELRSKSEANAA